MQKNSVKTNYIYHVAYQSLTMLTPLITTPYISRILQPDGIGAYSYTYTMVQYFILILIYTYKFVAVQHYVNIFTISGGFGNDFI